MAERSASYPACSPLRIRRKRPARGSPRYAMTASSSMGSRGVNRQQSAQKQARQAKTLTPIRPGQRPTTHAGKRRPAPSIPRIIWGMREDDDVDLVIDAWAEALPDLDFAPLDVVSRLRRLSPRVQEVRRQSFAVSGLAPWEFELLSLLRQHGTSGMTPSAISACLTLSSGTVASRVDRLAARGLVVREQNAADSRSKIITLSPRGTKRVDEAMRHLVATEGEVLAALDRQQVSVLIECLRTISETLDRLD